jgi:sigma-B regulation protein RsbU (phosphoserine phosphatase)
MKKNNAKRTKSLRSKSVTVVLVAAAILSIIAVIISGSFYSYNMFGHYKKLAEQLADTAASEMSAEDIMRYYKEVKETKPYYDDEKYWSDEEYRAEYDKKAEAIKDEKYQAMLNTLFIFEDQSKERNDIEYIYVQVLDGNEVTYIFDADHTEEQYQLGVVRPVSDEIAGTKGLEYGIPAFISNTAEDGWLCSCMRPVLDADGNPVALVGVDISMSKVVTEGIVYLVTLIAIILLTVGLLIFLIVNGVDRALVKPINLLSNAARTFVEDKDKTNDEESSISSLNIKTNDEIETLSDSIQQMERDINEYIKNLTAVTAERERIGAELELATRIQADMLPNIFPAFPDREDFDIYASMTPAKEVGGDFYDFFLVDDKHLAMVMADVSGKGVPAALFMMMSKILIQTSAMSGKSPADVLESINNQICANNREEMFVTVWLGILDLESGILTAANAGHEKPIVKHINGDFEFFKDRNGFVIGGMSGLKYKNYEIQLEKGSKLFIYTDGVAEATNASDELYGIERMVDALNSAKDESPQRILERIKESVDGFVGEAPQFDDLTMLAIEFIGQDGSDDNTEEITFEATLENVPKAVDFVSEKAEGAAFSMKDKYQIDVAVDEIVSNVARYAYEGTPGGDVTIRVSQKPDRLAITVIDSGMPYNPLEKEDPDVTLSADERGIGGYGIFIVKKVMDEVKYEHKDGKNIFTMIKNI